MKGINLNNIIKVKLTPRGVDIFYHQYDELNKKAYSRGTKPIEPRMPEIDKDGYTEFTLWKFMDIYGKYMGWGQPEVIKPLSIFVQDEDIDEGV